MSKKDALIQDGDVTAKRHGARLVLTSYTPLITTETELYNFCDIDPDDWIVEKLYANAWTTPSKDVEKDLTFDSGVVTGTVKQSNDMRFGQNIQVKVTLLPKVLAPVELAISPIKFTGKFRRPAPPKDRPFTRHLIFGDPHFGFTRNVPDAQLSEFHDRRALDVIVQVAAVAKPDRLDIIGDWFDMSEFGKYLKEPKFYFTLQPAIYESFFWLRDFARLVPRIRLHEGNHDKRLPDAIKGNLPFAYGLRVADLDLVDAAPVLSIPNLLALDKLGIEWIDKYPNDVDMIAPGLIVNHGLIARAGPIETANAIAAGFVSEIFGHIHKRQYSVGIRTDATMETYEVIGFSPGCTCHIDHRIPGHKRTQFWSQGAAIVDVFSTGAFSITPIAIKDGVAAYNGRLFEARGRLDELRKARPEWRW